MSPLTSRSAIRIAAGALVLATAAGSAWAWTIRESDAGHASFVRQAVPILLGRKVRGHDEVKLLADLAAAVGRETVVRALMEQSEFVDHWAEHLVDQLRVHREGPKAHTSCFGPRLRSGSDAGALAGWVAGNGPNAGPAPGGPFNMSDLVRSSLERDDLSPLYRAYLFALVNKPLRGNEITTQNKRDDLGSTFSHVYIHRQIGCLGCHNSGFSFSGAQTGWNRTHPIQGSFERSLYGAAYGIELPRAHAIFRTAVNPGFDEFDPPDPQAVAVQPWGLEGCGGFNETVPDDPGRLDAYFVRSYGLRGTVWQLEVSLREGVRVLAQSGLVRSAPDTDGDGLADTLNDAAAFAFLVAANVVNQTWTEMMGFPLTIANYFPRNPGQLDVLRQLTEDEFVRSGWSLKTLLARILTSPFFNRKPPKAGDGATPYELPMVFDPWVENDPRLPPEALEGWTSGTAFTPDPNHTPSNDPERHFNAMTESVHRYSPRSLLYSAHSALGWPGPQRFPGDLYPSTDLMKAIGQFFKDAEPGFHSVDFQGLLHWESVHGACAKPRLVLGGDWIHRLIDRIPGFDAANPNSPVTLSDLVMTMKDWIIGDSTVATTVPTGAAGSEAQALVRHFGARLTTRASAMSRGVLEAKLRNLCGVLLETPQFMLAGIAPAAVGRAAPRLRVCNARPCTYQEICNDLKPAVERLRRRVVTCGTSSVRVSR